MGQSEFPLDPYFSLSSFKRELKKKTITNAISRIAQTISSSTCCLEQMIKNKFSKIPIKTTLSTTLRKDLHIKYKLPADYTYSGEQKSLNITKDQE